MRAVLAVLVLAAVAAPALAANKPSSFVPHRRAGQHVYGSPMQPVSRAKSLKHAHAPKKTTPREPLIPKGIVN